MELVWGLFISSLPTRSASKAWSSRGDQQNAHRQILQQLETLRKEKADAKGEYPPNPPFKCIDTHACLQKRLSIQFPSQSINKKIEDFLLTRIGYLVHVIVLVDSSEQSLWLFLVEEDFHSLVEKRKDREWTKMYGGFMPRIERRPQPLHRWHTLKKKCIFYLFRYSKDSQNQEYLDWSIAFPPLPLNPVASLKWRREK